MIIKLADDRQPQQAVLQDLLNHPDADVGTKRRIEQEIRNIQAGIRGEEEAAYEMKVHFGPSANWMLIHDLRIKHDGLVAQIDHLLINRWLDIWVCESKHFSEGVAINEHGEFTSFFGNKAYGVPSPVEQNNRHILILKRLFDSDAIRLPRRLGFTIKPNLRSLVLVSKRARISRPKVNMAGLDALIKNDMLVKTIDRGEPSIWSLTKVVGQDTLEDLAHQIVELHRPIDFNWHAKFGLSVPLRYTPPANPEPRAPRQVPPPVQAVKLAAASPAMPVTDERQLLKQKLVCFSCANPLSYNVAKYCWNNKPKFGGNLFCMPCQQKV